MTTQNKVAVHIGGQAPRPLDELPDETANALVTDTGEVLVDDAGNVLVWA